MGDSSNDRETLKERFNIFNHQGNENQNDSDSILHLPEWLRSKSQPRACAGENVEKGDTSIACGNPNLYSHFGNKYVVSQETGNQSTPRPRDATIGYVPK